ncbi:MAG: CHASE domain-containing protein [Rhodospirillaceae bacterium]|nr:CHASE domain-containing protein [Rhodospirillaceae bacterium]
MVGLSVIWGDRVAQEHYRATLREGVSHQMATIVARLERVLQARLFLVTELAALARLDPEQTVEDFEAFASRALELGSGVRALALARDGVIRDVYPPSGMESPVGWDLGGLADNPSGAQDEATRRRLLLAGPVPLPDGGTALVARLPVFRSAEGGASSDLWGYVIGVLDLESMAVEAGLGDEGQFRYALRGREGPDGRETTILGEASLFDEDPVIDTVSFREGSWILGMVPHNGWGAVRPNALWFRLFGFAATVLTALSMWVLVRYPMRLEREILERHRYERDLVEARKSADKANQAKSEFLASMSHELRTPLNAILGFSEIIRDEALGARAHQRYREYAADIHDSGLHLLSLISDILDLAKIEAGKRELKLEAIETRAELDKLVHLVRERAGRQGLSVDLDVSDNVPVLWADRRAFGQIMLNLLSNAVKFTPPGGRIRVSAAANGDGGVSVAVVDTGCGIPPDQLERVIRPFEQVVGRRDATREGTGLGLAIVDQMMALHGGRLQLTSRVGLGTQATAEFPPHTEAA